MNAALSPDAPAPARSGEAIAALYVELRPPLFYVAARKFRVPECDAEALVQDAVLSLLTTHSAVEDGRAWLIAATCNLSRSYWRRRMRAEEVEGRRFSDVEDAGDRARTAGRTVSAAIVGGLLGRLRPRHRDVLRLHYLEGLDVRQLAERYATTRRYACKLITESLRAARRLDP